MPNGGPHNVYRIYCRHCGTENKFGVPEAYSTEKTQGTSFICHSCGEITLTLWEYLSSSRPFPVTGGTMFFCSKCKTAYDSHVVFKGDYCFFCGNRMRSKR